MTQRDLLDILYRHQDKKYADFISRTIPNIPRDRFIGIRTPEYKKILKELNGDSVIPGFLSNLPHTYHEENCLHGALLNQIKDFRECLEQVERFLPFIDNWAVNDSLNPPVFAKNRPALISKVQEWIRSEAPYTRRFGMHILMSHFLTDSFRPEYLELPANLRSQEYYVNMMTAWLFAEALVKQWNVAIYYIETQRLDQWTHNKTIQKACESFRITDEQKAYLKSLKRNTQTENTWKHPVFTNHEYRGRDTFEATPFVWNGDLYCIHNFHKSANYPDQPPQYRFHEDGCFIRRISDDTVLSYPWLNHYFSTVNVVNDKLVLIGGDYEWDRPFWTIRHVQMMISDDLLTWSRPVQILEANDTESIFNNCLVWDGTRYVLLYETNDPRWPIFTFRFAVSDDLLHWTKLPEDYIYGTDKYVGGPGLYKEGDYIYLLYLAETFGRGEFWDTRIARTKDLKHWEDAKPGRSFVYPNAEHIIDPVNGPDVHEINASDVELVEFGGDVHIWWNGGNQWKFVDLQHAVYHGTRRQLLEAFFE